jgi:hypothetical protein
LINITYPVPYVAETALTYSYRQKLPIKRPCPLISPNFLLNESDSWNCNLCGADKPFFMPFQRGDIIPFQTNFADTFNTNPEVINYGFKDSLSADWYVMIELQDENGAILSSFIDTFCSEYNVAFSDLYGSVQTWFLNTALFPISLTCFRLKVTYYTFNQVTLLKEIERVIFTEYYRKIIDCEKYIGISSIYDTIDCYGNIYSQFENYLGTSNSTYYNFVRIEGEVEFMGNNENIEVETDRGIILRKEIISEYQVKGGIIAPYFARLIDSAIRGKNVTISGISYDTFSFGKNNDSSREWLVFLTMQNSCTIDNRNCTL